MVQNPRGVSPPPERRSDPADRAAEPRRDPSSTDRPARRTSEDAGRRGADGSSLSRSGRLILKFVGLAVLAVALVQIVGVAKNVLFVIFGGVIFASYLTGLTTALSKRTPLGHGPSVAVVYVLHILAFAALVPWWMMQGQEQAEQLINELPRAAEQVRSKLVEWQWGRWLIENMPNPVAFLPGGEVAQGVQRIASAVISGFAGLAVLVFVGAYVGLEPHVYRNGLLRVVPPKRRERASEVINDVIHTLRMWLVGRILGALIIGAGVTIGLYLLDVPLALMLGLLSAALTFIPNFGPLLSVIPPTLFALTDRPGKAVWVLGLFAALQIVESYFLTPLIQRWAIRVPPALLISVQIVFTLVAGIVGLAFAAPFTAVVLVLIEDLYVQDVLAEPATS